MNPCCPIPGRSSGTLVSSANASVAGEVVTVEYYLTQDPTVGKWWYIVTSMVAACSNLRMH